MAAPGPVYFPIHCFKASGAAVGTVPPASSRRSPHAAPSTAYYGCAGAADRISSTVVPIATATASTDTAPLLRFAYDLYFADALHQKALDGRLRTRLIESLAVLLIQLHVHVTSRGFENLLSPRM